LFDWLSDPHIWASFIALSAMEVVLGIDNVVFISVMVARMPPEQRLMARRIGLSLALVFRVIMLAGITWFIHLTTPIFSIGDYDFSWRDLLLIAGGLFLLVKGTREIHEDIEGDHDEESGGSRVASSLTSAIIQIALIDLVFSVDSIITAVGMADHVEVMIAAVAVAILVMYFASEPVAAFIERHPTTKMLALSFLLLIGAALIADGFHFHIPRAYIYFAMAFSAAVEGVNVIALRRRHKARAAKQSQRAKS
jgi:predicted tellurium resistance membrane protein TerC